MNTFSHVPPGFRFHPTDEELVDYYLRKKINSRRIDLDVIKDIDLYKIEPWDLQELCRLGTEEQTEWYFFSHKDKKYPTGTRTNRATTAGFWKATGRDKAIYSKHDLVGMRKTLVFYKGRAPNGQKSDWIMHEYRLESDENATTTQEEGWVVCRVFKKRLPTMRRASEHESPIWYDDHQAFMPADQIDSPNQINMNSSLPHLVNPPNYLQYPYNNNNNGPPCKRELRNYQITPDHHFLQHLPLLESPTLLNSSMPIYAGTTNNIIINNQTGNINYQSSHQISSNNIHDHENQDDENIGNSNNQLATTDWRVLDRFVASQLLSQGDVNLSSAAYKENNHYNSNMEDHNMMALSHDDDDDDDERSLNNNNKQENEIIMSSRVVADDQDHASNSISSCNIDLWK